MYIAYIAGGIASGKSSFARELERLGAWRLDLDHISREVLEPGTPTTWAVAQAFGDDLLDPETGELDRRALAARAFATPEGAALLEEIELPAIRARLAQVLTRECCAERDPACCVVEVPLLDRMGDALGLADEVVVVSCPAQERVRRAVLRGMDPEDAEARMANQPSDEWLRAHADTIIENRGSEEDLLRAAQAWWRERAAAGWTDLRERGADHES